MQILRGIFRIIAKPGIIGPHGGYEEELLLAGAKPIGIFSEPVYAGEYSKFNQLITPEKQQIARLDGAVARGDLIKRTIKSCPREHGTIRLGHFYAQPHLERELKELAEFHEHLWKGLEEEHRPVLDKDIGEYLGYTVEDVNLWKADGYNPDQLLSRAMIVSSNLRRYCRAKVMLWDAEDQNSPPLPQ